MERRKRFDAVEQARLKEAAQRVFASYPHVVAAYLYGSGARGEPAADLDVAIVLDEAIAPRELEQMAAALQHEGAPHGPELDLRALNGAAPRFKLNVLREGRLLFERDARARLEAEASAMAEWLDFAPVFARMRDRMRERWTRG